MTGLVYFWGAPEDCGWSNFKPLCHTACSLGDLRRTGAEATVVWVIVVLSKKMLYVVSAHSSCCILVQVRDIYWSAGYRRAFAKMTLQVIPAEHFMPAFHSSWCVLIPGCFFNWNGCSNYKSHFTVFTFPNCTLGFCSLSRRKNDLFFNTEFSFLFENSP